MPARAVLFLRSEREKSFYSLPFSWPHNEGFKANPELVILSECLHFSWQSNIFIMSGTEKVRTQLNVFIVMLCFRLGMKVTTLGAATSKRAQTVQSSTFMMKTWSKYHGTKAKTKLMAEAGFYYAPSDTVKDCVACYACGLELDHWEKNDDPWEEHRQRRHDCPHIVHSNNIQEDIDEGVASIANTVAETLTILEPIQSLPIEDESMQSKPSVSKKKKPVAKRTGRNVKTSKAKAVKSETQKEIIEKAKETDDEITPEKTNGDVVSDVSIEIPASSTSESTRKTRKKKNEIVEELPPKRRRVKVSMY
ncbi:inhibitor of apoptosis repeat-containing protein [Rozella allomycis CSF55]|uniref:Inhibitor of apoptosis repeat-containing protein n=1 Tax=Rozella allomycis (strain CSF55) TaxID=988480 RepID=A0A4P9YJG0_ROZAC|nr:inhibitor of apoptosis repeat-containing protein [Rozella allomycis CSF55]